jgi:hypothetical protein
MAEDRLRFETILYRPEGRGTSTFARCPFPVAERFGARGRIPVAGTMNGRPFRGMLMPWGDGTHFITVDRALREAAGVKAGDRVLVECWMDAEPRSVELPAELAEALAADPEAEAAWEALAPSHRKEFARWISEAKRPETRSIRVVKTAAMLRSGEKLK